MAEFSDHIVFVDESGDHGLEKIDQQFPVFALVFCVVEKSSYQRCIVPAIQDLKFRLTEVDGMQGIQPHECHTDRAHGQSCRNGLRPIAGSQQKAPDQLQNKIFQKIHDFKSYLQSSPHTLEGYIRCVCLI